MYSDVESGVRFLSAVEKEGGNTSYDIIPQQTITSTTANNANSAVGGISEVGMLPPVGYSIATGASFSIPLQAGSAHAQAMCGNRTGDVIYWLEAVTYVGAGTANWGSYRVCRSTDYMKTAQIMGTYSSPEGQSIMVCNPRSLACNNDGSILILPYLRGIGISTNGGATARWVNLGVNPTLTPYLPEADLFFSEGQYICCSENGQNIYVVGRRNGYFAKSTDCFNTFSYTVPWVDGDNVHSSYGFIQRWDRSTPSGLTTLRTPETYDLAVSGICCSRDGRYVAVAQCLSQQTTPLYRGRVWVSDDFGFNFLTKVVTDCDAVYTYNYGAISMSESGQYIIVGHNYNFTCPANDSRLHYSDNYGATFQTLNNSNAGLPLTKYAVSRIKGNADYKYIWMNDELSKFMAYSTNSGATWTIWSDTKDVDAAPVRRYDGMHVSAWGEHAYYIYNSTIRRIEMLPLIFGLASTADIGFDTNSTRRMTIKQDGKIGINTITPDEQLDVAGNVKLRGNLLLPDDNNRNIGTVNGNALASINVHNAYCKAIQVHTATGGDIGTSSKRFNNVYATTFTGTLAGNASSATYIAIPDTRYASQFNPKRPTASVAEFRARLQQEITELCEAGAANLYLGVGNHWGVSKTIVPWNDPSGGRIYQYYYASNGAVYFRKSDQAIPTPGTEAWFSWKDVSPDKCLLTDSTDTITGTKTFASNILSSGVATLDIGSSGNPFNNIYGSKIVDCQAVRAGASSIPFMQNNNASSVSGQNVLWQHTTNEATPTNFQLLIETKGTTGSYERLQISSYRNSGYRNMHLQPSGRVMIGGDYSATAPTDTLDVGGGMTVRGNISTDGLSRDIGASGAKFKDIYATNGTIQTSDEREKKDVVLLDSNNWLSIISKLHPVSYKFINNESDRNHTGFISQQVLNDIGFELADRWGFYIKSTVDIPQEVPQESFEQVGEKRKRETADVDVVELLGEEEKKDGYEPVVEEVIGNVEDVKDNTSVPPAVPPTITKEVYGLRYTELIAPLVACVQELNKRILLQQEQIAQLATQIAELKQGSAL